MGEDRFEMGQKERDRLKILHEAATGLITQKQAAGQLHLCERQVRRLVAKLRSVGDRAVLHGLRGRRSNRRLDASIERRAMEECEKPECADFGPTYAAEHFRRALGIAVGKDTVRKWMMAAGLWQSRPRRAKQVHQWRQRRECAGELVQWDTSVHDWLEGRGQRLYLIAMIDDATSQAWAQFVTHDTTEQNMRVLWRYLEQYGRPLAFYTDKAAIFETSTKQRGNDYDAQPEQTQMTRALAELGIERISAHSPQAKGRVERFFGTAQDRLVKGLRVAGVSTLDEANAYLETEYLPEWNRLRTVTPANATDAHRALSQLTDLPASLSHVEKRKVTNNYTFPLSGQTYKIAETSIVPGLKGSSIRVEARLDGTVAARFDSRYLEISVCPVLPRVPTSPLNVVRKDHNRNGRSAWMKTFSLDRKASLKQQA
jgi:Integrase core domain